MDNTPKRTAADLVEASRMAKMNMERETKSLKNNDTINEIKATDEELQELTIGNWLMTFLYMDVPIIGYIILLVGAFSKKSPRIKKSMCKAYLIKKLIFTTLSVIILVILFYIGSYWLDKVLAYMQQL